MKRALLLLAAVGCASSRAPSPGVPVYEAVASEIPSGPPPLEGCRSVAALPPVEISDYERYGDDPYRRERREAAGKGGNVLLASVRTLINRPNLECPSSDRSPACLRSGRSWYRVTFDAYSCSPEALARLAALPPEDTGGPLTIKLSSSGIASSELKAKLLTMKAENVSEDVMVAYVRGQKLRKPLTSDEIIDWKRAGISDAVIEAAVSRSR